MSEARIIKIFEDEALTQEIENGDTFNFGIVKAGESKRFEYWVFNTSRAFVKNLEFVMEHDEVEIIDAPTELLPGMRGRLVFEWNPSVTLKQGLRAKMRVSGKELWGF